MLRLKQNWGKTLAVAITLLYIGLAIFGGVINYSPVGFWDMWDGYLDFYVRAMNGDWNTWWQQHNEHRIVLARVFFWMDLHWFQGAGWFLIVVNYALIALSSCVFYACLREQGRFEDKNAICALGLMSCAWLFSWSQSNNLTWGFQSQFILAQLLPLISFYCLHRAACSQSHNGWYTAACIAGIASVGTMANGILALPLMLVLSLLLKLSWRKSLLIAVLALVTISAYFYDYRPNTSHGSLQHTILDDPFGMLQYILLYVGGPFYYLTGKGQVAQWIAQGAGLFLVVSSVRFAFHALRQPTKSSLSLALLAFILYIGGTAVGTAGGRLIFGLDQATSSRYMTPALMAWAALWVLYAPRVVPAVLSKKKPLTWSLAILILLMFSRQITALRTNDSELFERMVAALALELRINDEEQIATVYPSSATALALTEQPVKRNLSIFGLAPIKDAALAIGTLETSNITLSCKGSIEEVSSITSEGRYAKINGWLNSKDHSSAPTSVHLVNGQGTIIGYAIADQIESAVRPGADSSEFKGYVLSDYLDQDITVVAVDSLCSFNAYATLKK